MPAAADDDATFHADHAFGPLRDPLDAHFGDDHDGLTHLRDARDLLDAGHAVPSRDAARRARSTGVPAELAPYLALVSALAALHDSDAAEACGVLADAWRDHPDVAALPAALGVALAVSGDATAASQAMFAALVSDDPDRSLALHRRRLTALLPLVR